MTRPTWADPDEIVVAARPARRQAALRFAEVIRAEYARLRPGHAPVQRLVEAEWHGQRTTAKWDDEPTPAGRRVLLCLTGFVEGHTLRAARRRLEDSGVRDIAAVILINRAEGQVEWRERTQLRSLVPIFDLYNTCIRRPATCPRCRALGRMRHLSHVAPSIRSYRRILARCKRGQDRGADLFGGKDVLDHVTSIFAPASNEGAAAIAHHACAAALEEGHALVPEELWDQRVREALGHEKVSYLYFGLGEEYLHRHDVRRAGLTFIADSPSLSAALRVAETFGKAGMFHWVRLYLDRLARHPDPLDQDRYWAVLGYAAFQHVLGARGSREEVADWIDQFARRAAHPTNAWKLRQVADGFRGPGRGGDDDPSPDSSGPLETPDLFPPQVLSNDRRA
jgi:hypothetical protein